MRPRTPHGAGSQCRAEHARREWESHPSRFGRRLLAAAHRLRRAFACTSVGARALTVDGKPAAVTDTAVCADFAEALDRLRAVAMQIALHLQVLVDVLTQLRD